MTSQIRICKCFIKLYYKEGTTHDPQNHVLEDTLGPLPPLPPPPPPPHHVGIMRGISNVLYTFTFLSQGTSTFNQFGLLQSPFIPNIILLDPAYTAPNRRGHL